MNRKIITDKSKKKANIRNSTLILLAFASAFFPRIIETAGAPSIINFIHFPIVLFTVWVSITTTQNTNRHQIDISWKLISGLLILLGSMTISALINDAGAINLAVDFLMLGEPFMIMLTIACATASAKKIKKLQIWLLIFALTNFFLAFIQHNLLLFGIMSPYGNMTLEDSVQGVFFASGAGTYVSSTVSIMVALYFLIDAQKVYLWLRLIGLFAALYQVVISDSKQVFLPILLAWVILSCIEIQNLKKVFIYAVFIIIIIQIFFWCVDNLEAFGAFKNWTERTHLYALDGEGTQTKIGAFRLIPPYYQSSLNWLFGLGPGHTVSRLGGWIIKEKWDMLAPLGATIHPVSDEIWADYFGTKEASESTMFSPFFGWAGIWGDLGFVGLGAYLYLSSLIWRYICVDNFSKFMLLSIGGFGLIFTQMEEPGYMLTMAMILGLRWQEKKLLRKR